MGCIICSSGPDIYARQIGFYEKIVILRLSVPVNEAIGIGDIVTFRLNPSHAISTRELGTVLMLPLIALFWAAICALLLYSTSGSKRHKKIDNQKIAYIFLLLIGSLASGITANRGINHRLLLIPYGTCIAFLWLQSKTTNKIALLSGIYSYFTLFILGLKYYVTDGYMPYIIQARHNIIKIDGKRKTEYTLLRIAGSNSATRLSSSVDISTRQGSTTQERRGIMLAGIGNNYANFGTLPLAAKLGIIYINQKPGEQHPNEKWNLDMHSKNGRKRIADYYSKNIDAMGVNYVAESLMPYGSDIENWPKDWLAHRSLMRYILFPRKTWNLFFEGRDINIWERKGVEVPRKGHGPNW